MNRWPPFSERVKNYIELGYDAFPLRELGKNPLTPNGFKAATTDEHIIEMWSKDHPNANIGISMHQGVMLVIDIDGKENKWRHQELFESADGIVETPNGWHFYFKNIPEYGWSPSAGLLAPNVDVRVGPSYVVAPWSHVVATEADKKKGKQSGTYRWIRPLEVGPKELSPPPQWLIDELNRVEKDRRSGKQAEKPRQVAGKVTENRNVWLTKEAGRLRKIGYETDTLCLFLLTLNNARCEPPLTEQEVTRIGKSVGRYNADVQPEWHDNEPIPGPKERTVIITGLDTVVEEEIDWVWYPYIARGKITLIEGDPEAGKTWLMINIMSLLSKGDVPPNRDGVIHKGVNKPMVCLYIAEEDGIADTLLPRVNKCGGDTKLIKVYGGNLDGTSFTFENMEDLIQMVELVKPDIIGIDPIQGYLGGADMHRANEVRPLMTKLKKIAEKYKFALVGLRHCRKTTGDKAMYKGLGSIDFTAIARSVIYVGTDPNNPTEHVMVHTKSSVTMKGPSLRYELTQEDGFKWLGVTHMNMQELDAKPKYKEPTKGSECTQWLSNLLAKEPDGLNKKVIMNVALNAGYLMPLVESAAKTLKVIKDTAGFGVDRISIWKLKPI